MGVSDEGCVAGPQHTVCGRSPLAQNELKEELAPRDVMLDRDEQSLYFVYSEQDGRSTSIQFLVLE